MAVLRLFVALAAILFGSLVVYLVVAGHPSLTVFGIELTRGKAQAGCIVSILAQAVLSFKFIADAFVRSVR